MIGWPPYHKSNSTLGSVSGHIPQSLLEEVVMPQIGVWVIWNYGEVHDNWQSEQISCLDGHIERRIIHDAHCPLHPVDDASAALARRAIAAHHDARLASQPG
jgi:hypothetical protein